MRTHAHTPLPKRYSLDSHLVPQRPAYDPGDLEALGRLFATKIEVPRAQLETRPEGLGDILAPLVRHERG
jgi:hypothetical protein